MRFCLSRSNEHVKFVSLFAAESQMHVLGTNLFYMSKMNLSTVSSFACVACEHYLVKLGYVGIEGFTFNELKIMFANICCRPN